MLPHLMVLAMSILHTIAWQVYCMFESVVVSYNSSKTTVLMENSGLKKVQNAPQKSLEQYFSQDLPHSVQELFIKSLIKDSIK